MENYSVVLRQKGKEVGRSKGMPMEKALAKVRAINRSNSDLTYNSEGNSCYIEETQTVKHLPVVEV